MLKKENRPIVAFHNPIQLGYVGSTNKALKALDTDYFVFKNNDVLLDNNCLQELFSEMVYHPENGVVPKAKFIHKVSISTSDKPDFWTSILSGNRLKFWTKWGESLQKCLI